MLNKLLVVFLIGASYSVFGQNEPIAKDDRYYRSRDGNLTLNLLESAEWGNDYNPLSGELKIFEEGTDKVSANGAQIKILNTKEVLFVPKKEAGWDKFKYVVINSGGFKDTGNVDIYILSSGYADVENIGDEAFKIINAFDNDIIAPTAYIDLVDVKEPKYGKLSLLPNALRYDLTEEYNGKDSFEYRLCDSINGLKVCFYIPVVLTGKTKSIIIPSGLSPNGDGINDELEVISRTPFTTAVLKVFNRQGDLVYTSQPGYKKEFTGFNWNNEALPNGTYYYIYMPNKTGFADKSGSITIMR